MLTLPVAEWCRGRIQAAVERMALMAARGDFARHIQPSPRS
jgi:1,2-phenylacetyl-CoA epoxidase PaaB subunit